MKEILYDEIKSIQLDILCAVDEFCEKHNIRYSLAYGTLIGAIRHKGYIPWDDDIDIMMPRVDYDRFISSFNGSYEHISLMSPELDKSYYSPFANVFDNRTLLLEGTNGHRGINIGVKIDVFPIDYVSSDIRRYVREMQKVDKYNYILYIKRLEALLKSSFSYKKLIRICLQKILYCCLPYQYLQDKIHKVAVNHLYFNSEYVDNVVYNIYSKKCTRFKASLLESYTKVNFEGKNYSVIMEYDELLRIIYGDYMRLPPEDKRVPHHDFKAYWQE